MAGTLSAFFDESGQENRFQPESKYYLLTVVLHNQGIPIDNAIKRYEQNLYESHLPDVPFHAYDLYHTRSGYAGLGFETRKKLFARFSGFVRQLPITYWTFTYTYIKLFGSSRTFKANHLKQVRRKLHH